MNDMQFHAHKQAQTHHIMFGQAMITDLIFGSWSFTRCMFIMNVTVAKSKYARAKISLYFFS